MESIKGVARDLVQLRFTAASVCPLRAAVAVDLSSTARDGLLLLCLLYAPLLQSIHCCISDDKKLMLC